MLRKQLAVVLGLLLASVPPVRAAEDVKITPDVVYGHKYGMALTFDVFTPARDANGAGVLFMVSGGWYSNWRPPASAIPMFQPMLDAGFTVFAVRHGSSPKFSIPEAVADVRRSVRYIRAHADTFGIDADRLGVCGMSAGGHLSLILGTTADEGELEQDDPLSDVSSRVQAVVAYVPPTDLRIMVWDAEGHLPAYDRFPALELDLKEAAVYSPLLHVTPDDAPTLLIAGKKDDLVPIKHSEDILKVLQERNVPCELLVFAESGHGLRPEDMQQAMARHVAWLQTYLTPKAADQ